MGCVLEPNEWDDKMLEESARGANFDPDLKDLEEYVREIADIRDELQRVAEESTKEETRENFEKVRAEWNQLPNEVKEILPLARVDTEETRRTSATIKASERWDSSGLFSKSQIDSFLARSPLYRAISSKIDSVAFRGPNDDQYGEVEPKKGGRYNVAIYHPTFMELAAWDMPVLAIQEKVAEEMLVTIAHENAEVYWKEFMPKEQQDKWEEICVESNLQGKPEISPLAEMERDDPKTKFCEWVGYFELHGDNICQVDENKYDFIKTLYSSLAED